jgi:hypothetical protein
MICSCWILQRFFRHQELMAVSETAKARPALADADELLAAFDELERDLALPRGDGLAGDLASAAVVSFRYTRHKTMSRIQNAT